MRRALRFLGLAIAALVVVGLLTFLGFSTYSRMALTQAEREYAATFEGVSLSEMMRPEIPAETNAATWLIAGSRAIVDTHGVPTRLSRTSADSWSAADRELAQQTLAANRPALELLARTRDCTGSNFGIIYTDGAYAELPNFLELVRAHRLVLTQTRIALADRDFEKAASGLEQLAAIADALAGESLLVSASLVLSLDLGYLDALRETLERGLGNPDWLAEIEALLRSINRREVLRTAFGAEATVADSLAMATLEQAWGSPVLGPLARPSLRLMKVGFIEAPTEAVKHLDTPFAEWAARNPEPEPETLNWQGSVTAHPHLLTLVAKLQTQETARQLALEAVRLARTQLISGNYPNDDRLPPSDPLTGAPYERTAASDGAVTLASPQAEEFYRRSVTQPDSLFGDLFNWRLPARPAES